MQFISKDPARADGEMSAYLYCGNDPVNSTDPAGLWGWGSIWGAVNKAAKAVVHTIYHAVKTVVRAVVHVVKKVVHAVVHAAKRVVHAVVHAAKRVYHAAKKAYHYVKKKATSAYHKASAATKKIAAEAAATARATAPKVAKVPIDIGKALLGIEEVDGPMSAKERWSALAYGATEVAAGTVASMVGGMAIDLAVGEVAVTPETLGASDALVPATGAFGIAAMMEGGGTTTHGVADIISAGVGRKMQIRSKPGYLGLVRKTYSVGL
jgi:hypothetical protein